MNQVFRVPAMRLPADCELLLPGSKSYANRAIVCACLCAVRTMIRNSTPCDDVLVMVENLKKLGFNIEWVHEQKGELKIVGGMPKQRGKATLDCHNAGTTLRFLASIASLIPGEWTLTGDVHMKQRPIGDLVQALRALGVDIQDTNGCPPLRIVGGTIRGSHVLLKADQSSQFLTSLLLVAPLCPEGLMIEVAGEITSSGYIELTKKVMQDFGVHVKQEKNTFFVQKTSDDSPVHTRAGLLNRSPYYVEGDWSAAGAWLVLSALTGSRIVMRSLRTDSVQSDRLLLGIITRLQAAGDQTIDCSEVPDQTMNIAVFSAFRRGKTTLTGIKNLRKKECDRIRVTATEFRKAGVDITEQGDNLVIRGAGSLEKISINAKAVILDPHDDHRMAMCFVILGIIRGNVSIKNPDCVWKSYPTFFMDLEKIISETRTITVVGMRGVGKSALGRKLASKIGLRHVDSDHLFQDAHGPIKDFIAAKGWDEFRKKEEEIIVAAVRPGIVLSLGGGALTSAKTRKLIKEKTIAVWLQARESELVKRLQKGKRPPLTDLPIHEEVRKFLLERGPHYREVAAIEVSPQLRFGEQVTFVLQALRKIFLGAHSKSRR